MSSRVRACVFAQAAKACSRVHVNLSHDVVRVHVQHGVVFSVLRHPCTRFNSVYEFLKRTPCPHHAAVCRLKPQAASSPLAWGRAMLAAPRDWAALSEPHHPGAGYQLSATGRHSARPPDPSRRCYGPLALPADDKNSRLSATAAATEPLLWVGTGQATKQSAYLVESWPDKALFESNQTRVVCYGPNMARDLQRLVDEFAPGCLAKTPSPPPSSSSSAEVAVVDPELPGNGGGPGSRGLSLTAVGLRRVNGGSYNRTRSPEVCEVAAQLYAEDLELWSLHCAHSDGEE